MVDAQPVQGEDADVTNRPAGSRAIVHERVSAEIEGPFVLFLIGMRINRPWKVGSWLPIVRAMPAMLRELEADPGSGFLGHSGVSMRIMVQYWRSFEHLEAYARHPERGHWPAWREFNRRAKRAEGDVGLWHETYLIPAGAYETIYRDVPPTGLGRAARLVKASAQRESARGRLTA